MRYTAHASTAREQSVGCYEKGYFCTGWRNAFLISPIRDAVAQYRIHRNGSLSMPLSLCILSSLAVHPVLSLLIASVS